MRSIFGGFWKTLAETKFVLPFKVISNNSS